MRAGDRRGTPPAQRDQRRDREDHQGNLERHSAQPAHALGAEPVLPVGRNTAGLAPRRGQRRERGRRQQARDHHDHDPEPRHRTGSHDDAEDHADHGAQADDDGRLGGCSPGDADQGRSPGAHGTQRHRASARQQVGGHQDDQDGRARQPSQHDVGLRPRGGYPVERLREQLGELGRQPRLGPASVQQRRCCLERGELRDEGGGAAVVQRLRFHREAERAGDTVRLEGCPSRGQCGRGEQPTHHGRGRDARPSHLRLEDLGAVLPHRVLRILRVEHTGDQHRYLRPVGLDGLERVTDAEAEGTSHLVGERELHGAVRPGPAWGGSREPANGGLVTRPEVAHPQDSASRQLWGAEPEVGAGSSGDRRPEHASQ